MTLLECFEKYADHEHLGTKIEPGFSASIEYIKAGKLPLKIKGYLDRDDWDSSLNNLVFMRELYKTHGYYAYKPYWEL